MGPKLSIIFLVGAISAAFIHEASCFTEEQLNAKQTICDPYNFYCLLSYCCNYKEACSKATTSTSVYNIASMPPIPGMFKISSISPSSG